AHFGVHYVRGPQITVQDALSMGVFDRVADLARVVERLCHIERAVARDDRLECFARDELHHDEEKVLLLLGGDDGDDVRMIEAGEEARLPQQLAEIEVLLVRNFECDLLVDPGVFREVDRAETAAAKCREDLVLTDDLPSEEHAAVYNGRVITNVTRPSTPAEP